MRIVAILAAACWIASACAGGDGTVPTALTPSGSVKTKPTYETAVANAREDVERVMRHRRRGTLRIAVISLPLYGHLLPLKAVAEALAARGHEVTFFAEDVGIASGDVPFDADVAPYYPEAAARGCFGPGKNASFKVHQVQTSDAFPASMFERVSNNTDLGATIMDMFSGMMTHHREQLAHFLSVFKGIKARHDVSALTAAGCAPYEADKPFNLVLTDAVTFVGMGVAEYLGVPYVSSFPLTMHLVVQPQDTLPSIGSGSSRHQTFPQRWVNFLLKLLVPVFATSMINDINAVREANHLRPLKGMVEASGLLSTMIATTTWGLDIPQALCPNVVPVGVLSPKFEKSLPIEPELEAFLSSPVCAQHKVVYVNFGTLSRLTDDAWRRLLDGLWSPRASHCTVIKASFDSHQHIISAREAEIRSLAAASSTTEEAARLLLRRVENTFVRRRFNNPMAILRHDNVNAFLTHCGDTSVGEAIEAEVPLAGIPVFADQGDVCQRVKEAGVGVVIGAKHLFAADDVVDSLATVLGNASFKQAMGKLHYLSRMQGGAQKAADVVEDTAYFRADKLLTCRFLNPDVQQPPSKAALPWSVMQLDVLMFFYAVFLVTVWLFVTIARRVARRWFGGPSLPSKEKRD